MRRLLILVLGVLLVSAMTYAQTPADKLLELDADPDYSNDFQVPPSAAGTPQITEDFEGPWPPDGWSVIDHAGSGLCWELGGAGTDACGRPNYPGTGHFALADSDCWGSDSFDCSLVTESYNFCNSVNSGMSVAVYYANYANYDWFFIDCDQGAGWENLLTWNEDHQTAPFDVSLDMSGFDGAPSVTCQFRYWDGGNPGWWWYVEVDDFVLESDGVITAPGVADCGGGGVPATTGIGLMLLVLALGGSSAYFLRRRGG
jgi:hypothetical protein